MEYEPKVEVCGQTWYLFAADYEIDEGKYGFYFYALSYEHAHQVLAAIKSTATIHGQICFFKDAGEDMRPPVTIN